MTRSCLPISARAFALFFVSLLLVGQAWTQADSSPAVERTFSCSVDVMQKALQQIGGFGGGKLPIVDGFVTATSTQPERLERPYYQYRVISVEAMISAWYADPNPARSEYRSLPSNGRLESDLLDRLQRALGGSTATSTVATSAPTSHVSPTTAVKLPDRPSKPAPASQEQLDAILTQRQAVREKTATLQAQIEQLKASDRKPANASRLASIKHSGVGVMSRQNFGGPVLFRAQAEDEFEVIDLQSGWAQVRLAPDTTAYIQADELALPDGLVAKAPDTSPGSSQAASTGAQRDLIPERMFWTVENSIEAEFIGEFELKGFKRGVRTYRVLGLKPEDPAKRAGCQKRGASGSGGFQSNRPGQTRREATSVG